MTDYPQTDSACIQTCISASHNILHKSHNNCVDLSAAKLKIDASRAVLQLVSDHIEHGLEIRVELIGSLLFTTDVSLAEASDAIVASLSKGGRP